MSRSQHVCLMAQYNQWMNTKVYQAALGLPETELVADRQAFFGSLLGTLNHLVVGDTLWLKRFAEHPAGYAALAPVRELPTPLSLGQILFADIQALHAHRQWLDRLILDWTASIAEADLDHALAYHNSKGVPARKDFFSLLMHFFNHQTHHRGQVTTLLSQAGAEVGVTDLLALIADRPD
ncbi:DinB family protein [Pseudomonas zhanjiangensis]|uniref:DinB family protein n=1 Tax=Pseudomonas zhanjiangensis TaxID=3239015 RepID=A0ABV3YPN5_9PSED